MSSLMAVLASEKFNKCPDCKIIPHEGYNEVYICPPCRAAKKEHEAWAASLEPTEENIREVVNGRVELLDADLIYSHFYDRWLEDMPYGVQKARDGDPYEWVFDRLCEEYGHLIEEAS